MAEQTTPPTPSSAPAPAPAVPGDPGLATSVPTDAPKDGPSTIPDKYDLKLPQGVTLQPEALDRTAAVARELGLSNEAAQKLLDHEVGIREAHAKSVSDALLRQQTEQHRARVTEWKQQIEADPELGGDKLNGTVAAIERAMERFATKELKEQLNATGLGNHPELVKCFVKIGNAMKEDKLVGDGKGGTPSRKSDAEVFYGNPS